MRLLRFLLTLVGTAALSACATTSPFIYDPPASVQEPPSGATPIAVVVLAVRDQRKDTSQDIYLDGSVRDAVHTALLAEMQSTGLCRAAAWRTTTPQTTRAAPAQDSSLIITPTLLEMTWYVPGHDAQLNDLRRMGPFAGLIMGTQETVVAGRVKLRLEIADSRTQEVLLDRTYDGIARDRFVVFQADRPSTKAVMMGRGLKVALEKAKADLARLVPAVPPSVGPRP